MYVDNVKRIPIYQPDLTGKEKEYVNECLDTNWISSKGKFVKKFEEKFAKYLGASYATAVCNGTSALHTALLALGIKSGDEVIVPSLTYISSANAVVYTGAKPVFADCEEKHWQLYWRSVERKITKKTKAIMLVHLYGHPCDFAYFRKFGLPIIEDCAESLGSMYLTHPTGVLGDISAFSFFANKTITTGEGGMVVTNSETLYERAYHYKGLCVVKGTNYYHDGIGYNYRMTNIAAAIGLAQLERIENTLKRKREIAEHYSKRFIDIPMRMQEESYKVSSSNWLCSFIVEEPYSRDDLTDYLAGSGIETRPVFPPIHTLSAYNDYYSKLPISEYIGKQGISLPSWPGLTDDQLEFICLKVREFFRTKGYI